MKTTQEVIEYIQGKKYPLFDLITIQGYLHAKGIEEEFNIGEGELFLAKDFIEWFENDKPKNLKLIEGEFYSYKEPNGRIWIYQYRKWKTKTSHFFSLNTSNDNLYEDGSVDGVDGKGLIKLATPEEKQQIINAVETEENKHWNESTKTFELQILVPENIKIIKYQNNQLGLVFNDNKQVLTFSEGVYIVQPLDKLDKFIPCRLEETTFEELNEGDIFIVLKGNKQNLSAYNILLPDNTACNIDYHAIFTCKCNSLNIIYKVIPIK